jgi:hypothetical protein
VWVTTSAAFVSAFIGTGMLTSVPQSMVFLLTTGWITVRPPSEDLAETEPASWPVRWTAARTPATVPAPEH